MTKMRLFNKTVVAVAIAMASQQAIAAGFQLNSQSATGLGRAFSGDAVIADNASSMARNAATMALFDETSMSLGVVMIKSLIEVKDATYDTGPGFGNISSSSDYNDAGTESFPPNFHLIVPVDDKFAWGVNAYSNFGTRTEFSSSFTGAEFGGETEILSVNFGLAASYRIDEQISLGAGIDAIYGQGTMKRSLSTLLGGSNILDIDGADGWGVGYNVGAVYEVSDNHRYGFSYRYSPDIEAKDGSKVVHLPLPDMAEFSGYHRLAGSKWAYHYSAQFIRWSEFDVLDLEGVSVPDPEYHWKDAYHLAIGATYFLNKTWILRAGYMFDESAQDETTSFSVPDSDRNWFSAGFTYNMTDKSNVDFGFTYLIGEDVDVTQTSSLSTSMTGKTHADAILLGLQYSRTF